MIRQRGQSMTEFAVCATVMVTLLLGTVTLAGAQKAQRRATTFSRQAAFQGAWLGNRTDRNGILGLAARKQFEDPAFIDATGRTTLVQPSAARVQGSAQPTPGLAHGSAVAMLAPLQIAGGFLGSSFDLPVDGIWDGSVEVDIRPASYRPQPFDSVEIPLRQPFALMTDAWNAAGTNQVRSRASGLVPTAALTNLQSLWRPLLAPLSLVEPSLAQLCFGLIEPDRIPEDRLGSGRTALPGRCP